MRLNLGSGPVLPADWTNVDPDPQWGAEVNANPRYGLPWIAGVAAGAVAHHSLMMVAYLDLLPWLREVRRVLAPGAYLRLSVPDLELVGMWLGECSFHTPPPPISDDLEDSLPGKVALWVSQAGATRSVFTAEWLEELCLRAGYSDARRSCYQQTTGPSWLTELDDQPDRSAESIYVDAIA